MDETDRDRVEEVQLLSALPPGHHQSSVLQQLQMLRDPDPDPDPGHVVTRIARFVGASLGSDPGGIPRCERLCKRPHESD